MEVGTGPTRLYSVIVIKYRKKFKTLDIKESIVLNGYSSLTRG